MHNNPHSAEEIVPHMPDSSAHPERSHSVWATVPSIDWQNRMMARCFIAQGTARDRIACEIMQAFDGYLKQMARSVWRRYGRLKGSHGLRDIESAGREGLVLAMKNWHPDRSKPLVHLASVWISGSCKAEARRQGRGAVDLPHKVRRLTKTYRDFCAVSEQSVAEDHLLSSRSTKRTRQVVRFLSQAESSTLSLSVPLPKGTDAGSGNLADDLETSDAIESIRQCLVATCSARDRLIFYLLHPDTVLRSTDVGTVVTKTGTQIVATSQLADAIQGNLGVIGKMLGLSRERVRQIDQEAFQKIRAKLGSELHGS